MQVTNRTVIRHNSTGEAVMILPTLGGTYLHTCDNHGFESGVSSVTHDCNSI